MKRCARCGRPIGACAIAQQGATEPRDLFCSAHCYARDFYPGEMKPEWVSLLPKGRPDPVEELK
jgi:hypothetical protein